MRSAPRVFAVGSFVLLCGLLLACAGVRPKPAQQAGATKVDGQAAGPKAAVEHSPPAPPVAAPPAPATRAAVEAPRPPATRQAEQDRPRVEAATDPTELKPFALEAGQVGHWPASNADRYFEVEHVYLGGTGMLVVWHDKDKTSKTIYVQGASSKGLADGSRVELKQQFKVGTGRLDDGRTVFTLAVVGP